MDQIEKAELDLIVDLQRSSERQGPGSEEETLRALELLDLPVDSELKIADLGCGSGGQTLTLAKNSNARITAVDLFPEFLDELNQRSTRAGLGDRIETLKCSIENLPFTKGEFDLIWSEGAIYNLGFEKGVKKWKEFIRPNGFLAVSEITWITRSRPTEIGDFWEREYPEIDTASNKISILENAGYTLVAYFYLKPESWINNYYKPLEAQFERFLQRNKNTELAKKVVQESKAEMEMYQKFKNYYSYGFYLARKN